MLETEIVKLIYLFAPDENDWKISDFNAGNKNLHDSFSQIESIRFTWYSYQNAVVLDHILP